MSKETLFNAQWHAPLVLDPGAEVVNPLHEKYGAAGNGTADDAAALSNADLLNPAPTLIPAGKTFRVGSNLTLTNPVVAHGKIRPALGVTVTLPPTFEGSPGCLDTSAGGSFAFIRPGVRIFYPEWWGAVGDGVTDDTDAIIACAAAVRAARGTMVLRSATYWYDEDLDLTATGAAIEGEGPEATTLLYGGSGYAVKVDAGGNYPILTVSSQTGTFQWGEVVTGGTSGATAVVRTKPYGTDLEVQPSDGDLQVGETITGGTSGATATVDAIGSYAYGSSYQSIRVTGLTIAADYTQPQDGFGRPTDWYDAVGLYINGARNHSEFRNIRISQGFRWGMYSRFNWLADYSGIVTQNCLRAMTWDGECNNIRVGQMAARRAGYHSGITDGWGYLFISSYGLTLDALDFETSNAFGIIMEHCRGWNIFGGDIENNDASARKIITRGRPGSDFANDQEAWTRGGTISGVRFRNNFGIEFRDGSREICVTGCTFSTTGTPSATGSAAIRRLGSATHIRSITIDKTNDMWGDSTLVPDLPYYMQASDFYSTERASYHLMESQELDVTDANARPIGYFATPVTIKKIQIFHHQTNDTGTCTVDLGVGGTIGSIQSDIPYDNDPQISVTNSPYGITEVSTFTAAQSAGAVRARIQDNTMGSGTIRIRIWYLPRPQ